MYKYNFNELKEIASKIKLNSAATHDANFIPQAVRTIDGNDSTLNIYRDEINTNNSIDLKLFSFLKNSTLDAFLLAHTRGENNTESSYQLYHNGQLIDKNPNVNELLRNHFE